ncbi:MAG: hypothetical protein J5988_03320 [Eubacterium sp.]|nr:hypothetical protein [Eubacterium sp.]
MLKTELKKIIFSPQYIICVVLLFALLMLGTVGLWSDTLGGETISMLVHFLNAWDTMGNVYIVVPLLASVPVTFLLHDELNSGYIHFSITRAGKRKYIVTKMMTGILSGLLMVLIAELLFTVMLILLTPGKVNFLDQQQALGDDSNFYLDMVRSGKGYFVYIIWVLLAGLYGAVFSAMAVATSAVARNKYVAAVVPFLIFLLAENVFFYFMYLPLILRAGFEAIFFPCLAYEWLSGIPISLGIVLLWTLASAVLFWTVIHRKIKGRG